MLLRFESVSVRLAAGSIALLACASGALASTAPSAPLVRYQFAAGDVTRLCNDAIAQATARLDAVARISPTARNFDNTMLAIEGAFAELADATTPLTFMGYVSTDSGIHAEGSDCEQVMGRFNASVSARRDLYLAVKDQKARNANEERLLSETLKGYARSGVGLPDAERAQLTELRAKLAELESQFSTNLNNDVSTVEFTADELSGVPAGVLARLKKTDKGYVVTTKENDWTDVGNTASREETRKRLMQAYYNRAAAVNVKLLEDAIVLRERIAQLLGSPTWADARIDGRMAKDAATVNTFLADIRAKLADRNRADLAKLLAFKRTLDPAATKLEPWDVNYMVEQLKKRNYSLDTEKIREFFPADVVIDGIFAVYSHMLGVKFTQELGASTWAPGVFLYRIEDAKSGEQIGHFYTDFFPRDGKYGHAAAFPLLQRRPLADGTYTKPISAIVANLTPPSDGKPSLLTHDEVQTIFHEFGHIMHQTLTKAAYLSLSGSNVAQDFVEAPSQMLENWVWSPEVLAMISGHYTDHTRKLPSDLLEKMLAARDFNQGYFYTRQDFLASLDMAYHTASGPVDTSALADRMYKEIISLDPVPGGHFQASFGHLMGGYDAGYYGYLWSEVYAQDMFTQFQAHGLLDPETGARYRRTILEQGAMKDAIDLLREFLGREPNSDAFLRKLHIAPDAAGGGR